MRHYPKEILDFVRANAGGLSSAEIASLVNQEFKISLSVSQIKALKKNHRITSGIIGRKKGMPTERYSKEVRDYINQNYCGVGPMEMAERLNEMFGTQYSKSQMKSFYANNKLNSGLDGRFVKGLVPANKGKHTGGGPEETRFDIGHKPYNTLPVGTRVKKSDGYWAVKTAEPNVWEQIHRRIWEGHNGKIPPGHVVIFGDGNKDNLDVNNLILVTKKQLVRMNQNGLIRSDIELTKTGIIMADMITKIAERRSQK